MYGLYSSKSLSIFAPVDDNSQGILSSGFQLITPLSLSNNHFHI